MAKEENKENKKLNIDKILHKNIKIELHKVLKQTKTEESKKQTPPPKKIQDRKQKQIKKEQKQREIKKKNL